MIQHHVSFPLSDSDLFIDFARRRFAIAGQKYTDVDGTNQALRRDNLLDVLEELADAYIIAELSWKLRGFDIGPMIMAQIEEIGGWLVHVYKTTYPGEWKHDGVERIATIHEAETQTHAG